MATAEKRGVLQSFPGMFWLVILFEFFERGSYYGVMSILSVYLTDKLGFPKENVGLIKGTISPCCTFCRSSRGTWPTASGTGACSWWRSRCWAEATC